MANLALGIRLALRFIKDKGIKKYKCAEIKVEGMHHQVILANIGIRIGTTAILLLQRTLP